MSTLEEHKLHYEDLPPKKYKFKKGQTAKKGAKMSKEATPKKVTKYNKSRGEHAKDLIIAVLVSSIIAFVVGMTFANKQNSQVTEAVQAAETAMTAEAVEQPVKK